MVNEDVLSGTMPSRCHVGERRGPGQLRRRIQQFSRPSLLGVREARGTCTTDFVRRDPRDVRLHDR